ncbi:MAG: cupredoxin domain-containing protein [Nitrososphaera sp.]
MGQPGKIAFPVILVLGAITGYLTYTYFGAAIPDTNRIDSPYYQPLSPSSSGSEQGSAGGAAQTGGAGGGGNGSTTGGAGGTATPAGGGATTTITILEGSAVQGSPDFDPDKAQVPMGNKVIWDNQDTVPHTATAGTGPQDPNNAKAFDTSIINPGEQSPAVELKGVSQGQSIPYHCMIHPYMTGQITVAAAAAGGGGGGAASNATNTGGSSAPAPGGAAQGGGTAGGGGGGSNETTTTTGAAAPAATGGGGPTINILEGASVQGSPDYDPDNLTAKKGDQVTVVNQDTVPHTATAGTGPQDPNSAKLFNTSIINPSESATISLAQANPGEVDFYCMIHPYMTGKITVG